MQCPHAMQFPHAYRFFGSRIVQNGRQIQIPSARAYCTRWGDKPPALSGSLVLWLTLLISGTIKSKMLVTVRPSAACGAADGTAPADLLGKAWAAPAGRTSSCTST